MNNSTLTVGVVGAGIVASNYHLPVLKNIKGIRVQWICDSNYSKASEVSQLFNIKSFGNDIKKLEKVNIILLAIPVGARDEYYEYAFKHRIHLLVEKPFSTTSAEHLNLLKKANLKKIHIGVGLMRRSYFSTNELASITKSKIFGNIKKIIASEGASMRGLNIDSSFYQNDPKLSGGGVLIETGTHLIDQIFYAFDINSFKIKSKKIIAENYLDLDVRIKSEIKSRNQKSIIKLDLHFSKISDVANKIIIEFENSNVSIGISPGSKLSLLDKNYIPISRIEMFDNRDPVTEIYQSFYVEWVEFIIQVRTNKKSKICASKSKLVTKFIENIYKHNE